MPPNMCHVSLNTAYASVQMQKNTQPPPLCYRSVTPLELSCALISLLVFWDMQGALLLCKNVIN